MGRMARSLTQRENWTRDLGDTDRTDFPGVRASYGHREAGCVFCALEGRGRVLLENELARCIGGVYPVIEGEALRCWGIQGANLIRPFSRDQELFLSAHREELR